MKKINIEKRYYTNNKDLVVAVACSDGRMYRAEAKCHPNDVFDYEYGKRLASLRCDMMIMQERVEFKTCAVEALTSWKEDVERELQRAEKHLNTAKEMRKIVGDDLAALLRAGVVTEYEKEGD